MMVHRPTDPRSPVQSQRSGACLPFVLAGFAALAFWAWQNGESAFEWSEKEFTRRVEQSSPSSTERPASAEARIAGEPQGPRANLVAIFSTDDYPVEAIRRNEQGTVGYQLSINRLGWVSGCRIVSSSGSEALDRATCNIIRDRARFEPARDANGRRATGQYSGKIRWELPDE
jgi:protein TonB